MNFLVSALLLAPAALAIPAPQDPTPSGAAPSATPSAEVPGNGELDPNGCTAKTNSLDSWDLDSFSLTDDNTTLSFTVVNQALEYTVACNVISGEFPEGAVLGENATAPEFNGEDRFLCTPPLEAEADGRVQFSFDVESGKLDFKQRWICRDDDPMWPVQYTGYGVANFTCVDDNAGGCAETDVLVEYTGLEAIS
ncbi:uncharacterized protein DNG_04178 [Cephalotrichum gorgonifer]|uniref:AA1-like domain-containing protein n=1 Tax=Cephalotrichum gorgonifer TaxID=2041049 RepID=A0AAE8MVJ7_9PEZI|nr:uncharacterized protein DNG_04178 [Cephalotrichum gorgonifer]